MRPAVLCLALAVLLAGCGQTTTGNAIRSEIRDRGALAADAALENAEWSLCNASTVGAVNRRYGPQPSKHGHWRGLCGYE